MKRVWLTVLLLFGAFGAPGQKEATSDELMRSADRWAQENLDPDVLRALRDVDQAKVRKLLADLQKQYQGEYVIDLAELRDTAKTLLPLLDQYEETAPYAAWLKAQLDYLDMADEIRLRFPPPSPLPGKPPLRTPNPTPQTERDLWLKKVTARPWPKAANRYIPRLKTIFAEEKVPAELVWLGEVESGFDPRARSPDGAVGLFQLRAATAKRYGLRVGLFDQRSNPEASARAAAQYLRALHHEFKDWRLVLAAYNAGEGTVRTLLKRYPARTFDAIAMHLPAETQMYVPRVEAVLFRREGRQLSQLR